MVAGTHFVPSGKKPGESAPSCIAFLLLTALITHANVTLHHVQAIGESAKCGASQGTNSRENASKIQMCLGPLREWRLITSTTHIVRQFSEDTPQRLSNSTFPSAELVSSGDEFNSEGRDRPTSGYQISRNNVASNSLKEFWTTESRHVNLTRNEEFWPWEPTNLRDLPSKGGRRPAKEKSIQQDESAASRLENDNKGKNCSKTPHRMQLTGGKTSAEKLLNVAVNKHAGRDPNHWDLSERASGTFLRMTMSAGEFEFENAQQIAPATLRRHKHALPIPG